MILYTIRTSGTLVGCAQAASNWSLTTRQKQSAHSSPDRDTNAEPTGPICRVILRHGEDKGARVTDQIRITSGTHGKVISNVRDSTTVYASSEGEPVWE